MTAFSADSRRGSEAARPARRIRLLFWLAGLGLAGLQCWFARHDIRLDGIAYLDMARGAGEGALVNGLWSPLYPALLAAALWLLRPSVLWQFAVPHLVNLVIFAAALAAFEFYWRELERVRQGDGGLPDAAWQVLGYGLFLWASLSAITAWDLEADLLMLVFLLLAAGLLLRVRRTGRAADFLLLGAAIGAGYLSKAPMLPLGGLMLALAVPGAGRGWRRALRGAWPALAVIALVVAGWAAALHARYGRWTIGDSAGLNYAWYVNGVRLWFYWQGGPEGSGAPVHPPRQVSEQPQAFVYPAPKRGTFPLWQDPAYWYEGVRPHFDLRQQARALRINLLSLPKMSQLGALACLLWLAVGAARDGTLKTLFSTAWPAWLAGAAGVGMYCLVHVEPRYAGGPLLLWWSGLFAGVRLRSGSRRVLAASALATGIIFAGFALQGTVHAYRVTQVSNRHWAAAQRVLPELAKAALGGGDAVVTLGDEPNYWLALAGLRVVGDIGNPEVPAYWALAPERRARLETEFRAAGALALVAGPAALRAAPGGARAAWQPLGDTGFALYRLEPASAARAE